jgi:hypothetical protein
MAPKSEQPKKPPNIKDKNSDVEDVRKDYSLVATMSAEMKKALGQHQER